MISTLATHNAERPNESPRQPQGMIALVGNRALALDLTCALSEYAAYSVQHWDTLDQFAQARRQVVADVALVIALTAHCHPRFDRHIQTWCNGQGLAFLRISVWQHEAVIGPFVIASQPGCVACAETRRIRALMHEAKNELAFLELCDDPSQQRLHVSNPWLTPHARLVLSLLAACDIQTFLRNGTPAMGFQTLRFLRLRALTNSCHTFLPDPLCDICARPEDDRPEDAMLQFQPRSRNDIHQYRARTVANELASLETRYVDQRVGLRVLPSTGLHTNAAAFATTVTHYFEYPAIKQNATGSGLAHTFRASRAIAILEALERSCGFLPRAKRPTVYGSYLQLHHNAIDPERFGLFSDARSLSSRALPPSHRFSAYSPDMPFHWVWAYSLRERQPVLVPEQIAYYGSQVIRPQAENFLFETSNGCAVGSSLEDAALHGLCEVIERDAFFLMWYARLPVPALDWRSTRDEDLLLAIERSMRMTGFTFHAFDCSLDFAVPVVLMVAVNKENRAPRVILGAAAHLDPDRALAAAFFETASTIVGQNERFPRDLAKGQQLVADSNLILNVEDHVLAGVMPEAFSRFTFLLAERSLQSMQNRFSAFYGRQPSSDLTEEFFALARQVIERGYDVVVVDQTSPELRAGNFTCIRVLVPGLIPLTFGHAFRRTRGLKRLYRLPKELGYVDHELTETEINTDPHAFP